MHYYDILKMLHHAGYKSVAHYLVLTHQAEAAAPAAEEVAAAVPAEAAADAAAAQATAGSEQPAGEPASFAYLLSWPVESQHRDMPLLTHHTCPRSWYEAGSIASGNALALWAQQ